jgi:hypothetical protein
MKRVSSSDESLPENMYMLIQLFFTQLGGRIDALNWHFQLDGFSLEDDTSVS